MKPKGGNVEAVWRGWKKRCAICRHAVAREDASRDHRVPRAEGGSSHAKNYLLAHRRCNSIRGRLPWADVLRMYDELKARLGSDPSMVQVQAELGAWKKEYERANPLPERAHVSRWGRGGPRDGRLGGKWSALDREMERLERRRRLTVSRAERGVAIAA